MRQAHENFYSHSVLWMRRSLDSLGNSPNPLRCVLMQIERFSLMQGKPYLSVATATFLSEGDFEGFKTKATTFNSEKALAYLKENGQRNFSIIRDDDEKSVRAMLVWEYESREAWQNCQEFWTSWFKYEDNYVAKATFVRGECIFDWSDS